MGPAPRHWLCGREGRRDDQRSRRPRRRGCSPAAPAAASAARRARSTFPRTASRARIAETGAPARSSASAGAPLGAPRPAGQWGSPDTAGAAGRRGGGGGAGARRALEGGSPPVWGVRTPLLGRPRVPRAPLAPEPPPKHSPGFQRVNSFLDTPSPTPRGRPRPSGPRAASAADSPESREDFAGLRNVLGRRMTRFGPGHRGPRRSALAPAAARIDSPVEASAAPHLAESDSGCILGVPSVRCAVMPVFASGFPGSSVPPGGSPRAHGPPALSLRALAGASPPVAVAPNPGKFHPGPSPCAPQRWSADFPGSLAGSRASSLSLFPGPARRQGPAFPCRGARTSGTLLGLRFRGGCAVCPPRPAKDPCPPPPRRPFTEASRGGPGLRLHTRAFRRQGPGGPRAWGRCQSPETPVSFSALVTPSAH